VGRLVSTGGLVIAAACHQKCTIRFVARAWMMLPDLGSRLCWERFSYSLRGTAKGHYHSLLEFHQEAIHSLGIPAAGRCEKKSQNKQSIV